MSNIPTLVVTERRRSRWRFPKLYLKRYGNSTPQFILLAPISTTVVPLLLGMILRPTLRSLIVNGLVLLFYVLVFAILFVRVEKASE